MAAAWAFLIFWLPHYVPLPPTFSDSYFFGYNNRAGVALLLAGLVLAGVFSGRLELTFARGGRTLAVSRRAVRVWMLVFLVACVGLWLLVRGLGGWGESRYMIDRVEALAAGQIPYRGFEFAYGPLMLYGPRALMLAGLSAADAYYFFWTACSVAGVWMLAAVIDRLAAPGARRTTVLHLFCWPLLASTLSTGTNDAAIRFLIPVWAALLTARMAERSRGHGGWRVALAAAAATAACLLMSPEMGIAFAAGMAAWLILQLARNGELFTSAGASKIAAVGVAEAVPLLGAARLGEFATLGEFGRGAFNFPILPAGYILVFFLACGLVAVYLGWCVRHDCADPGLLIVAAVSTPMLMPALGRCAPGHVALNGIGILLVATLLASSVPRLWQPYCAAFLLFVLMLPTATGLVTYASPLEDALADRRSGIRLSSALEPARIFPGIHGIANAPFGYFPLGLASWRSPSIDTGYYLMVLNAYEPRDTERKIAELRAHPERPLLLPEDWDTFCRIDPEKEAQSIELFFGLPWHMTARERDDVWLPLCDYIQSHYSPAASAALPSVHYRLWEPTGEAAPLSARAGQ